MGLLKKIPLPRYGMQTLILLTVCAAILFAWLAFYARQANHDQTLRDEIEILGPSIYYDYEFDEEKRQFDPKIKPPPAPLFLRRIFGEHLFGSIVSISINGSKLVDGPSWTVPKGDTYSAEILAAFQRVDEFKHVNRLSFHGCFLLRDISMVKNLPRLQRLSLFDCSMDNLDAISHLKELQDLNLGKCSSVQDLSPISSLPELRELNLKQTRFGDYSCIASLPKLQVLKLGGIYPGFEEAEWIGELESLEELYLGSSKLRKLPSLAKLKRLRKLDIRRCNQLESSDPLTELSCLTHLWVGEKSPLQILDNIDSLTNLQELYLQSVPIEPDRIDEIKKQFPSLKVAVYD